MNEFNFSEGITFNPENGLLLFKDQRVVMMSAGSFSELLSKIIDLGGRKMATIFIGRFGEASGRHDARTLMKHYSLTSKADWVAMGALMRSGEGFAGEAFEILELDTDNEKYHVKGTWKNSSIAEQYLSDFGKSRECICWFLSGYTSGFASEMCGKKLMARETSCIARGDDICRFEIRPVLEW